MTHMDCAKCGNPLEDASRFCGECGSPVRAPAIAQGDLGSPSTTFDSGQWRLSPLEETGAIHIEFRTSKSVILAREIISNKVYINNGKLKRHTTHTLVAKFGSNLKTRLFGIMIIEIDNYAHELKATISEENLQCRIHIAVRDTFGFGSSLGIAGKLQKMMRNRAESFKNAFSDAA